MLVENFPEVIDINFTSHIEEEFDEIAEGKIKWVPCAGANAARCLKRKGPASGSPSRTKQSC